MKSIPEKFEDLSQDEIMFFANIGLTSINPTNPILKGLWILLI